MSGQPAKGLADVIAASTAISDIDGQAGTLSYRGYDIRELAERASFEEVTHLLHRGALPTSAALADFAAELAAGRGSLGDTVERVLPAVAASPPMAALRTLVSALAADDPDAEDSSPEADRRKAVRLVAQVPVLLVRYWRQRSGAEGAPVEPDPRLGVAGNLLWQLTGEQPDPERAAILDTCLVLHADHTMNASTFAARVCAATMSDMHSAVTAAIGTLKGPLHGGANEAVMRMLERIPGVDEAPAAVTDRLARGEKIMGFGHRVYRTEDPRATVLRRLSARLAELTGDRRYFDVSLRIAEVVAAEKGLYPNVDFFAASVYHHLGIPTELFTPVFAVSRTAGWTAHVVEQHGDNRLIRPESEYVGPKRQHWMPIQERA